MSTNFYTKLASEGPEKVRRWTKGADLRTYDKIFVPIHDPGLAHWALGTINMRDKKFEYPPPHRVGSTTHSTKCGRCSHPHRSIQRAAHVACSVRPGRFMICFVSGIRMLLLGMTRK